MLKSLHHWLFGAPAIVHEGALRDWAMQQGGSFKHSHGRRGFVIDHADAAKASRIEWGPSQRQYLGGHELRIRASLSTDPATYALVMPRTLLDALEREVFSQYTGGVQTRLDEETPEEMRWLAMSPKLGPGELGALRGRFGAVGNVLPWLSAWLSGPLTAGLLDYLDGPAQAPHGPDLAPMALTVRRGQVVLRLGLSKPHPQQIEHALRLFEIATLAAARTTPPEDQPDGGSG
jgi:hypothetical protein